ncbi:SMI1/KNR4 family protein [Streptomyces sp. NPDC057654]|uniref:SMI1/KNR4 family protein n=1 Tax=Streptomyces sp. NPDC057654 TaxID=3346196 RepID=UPI003675FE33
MGKRRVEAAWDRVGSWLRGNARNARAGCEQVQPEEIEEAGRELGVPFPEELAASLLCRGVGGSFRFPGGAPMGPAEISGRTLMMREFLADLDGDGDGEGHDDYWHHDYLFITDDDVNGMVMDCRPGDSFGAIGWFSEYDGVRFGLAPSLGAYLEEVATCLESGRALAGYVPIAFNGELLWEHDNRHREESHPDPRSLLGLRAAAIAEPALEEQLPQIGSFSLQPEPEPEPEPVPGPWQNTRRDGTYRYTCLTFVHGIDETELLRRFGALDEAPNSWSCDEAVAAVGRRCLPVIRVGRATGGEWVFAAEERQDPIAHSGYGMREETLRRLSAGTRAVSLQIADIRMHMFGDGKIVSELGTNLLGREMREDLLQAAQERAGLNFSGPSLTQQERLDALRGMLRSEVGIDLDDHALNGPLTAAHILPFLDDPRRGSSPGGDLGDIITGFPDEQLRSALAKQVRRLADENGLAAYPEVGQALDDLDRGWTGPLTDGSPLDMRLRAVLAETQAIQRLNFGGKHGDPPTLNRGEELTWWRRKAAADALQSLIQLPPRAAAQPIQYARSTLHWRAELAADLASVRRTQPPRATTPTSSSRRR